MEEKGDQMKPSRASFTVLARVFSTEFIVRPKAMLSRHFWEDSLVVNSKRKKGTSFGFPILIPTLPAGSVEDDHMA